MLSSMTGFGAARRTADGLTVAVELRSVNNRHLKLSVRGTEPYPLFEAEIEKLLRPNIRRGSVLVQIRVDRGAREIDRHRLNVTALQSYKQQVIEACDGLDSIAVNAVLSGLLALPGLVPETVPMGELPETEWPIVAEAIREAAERLDGSRRAEGKAMAAELLGWQREMAAELEAIREQLPNATTGYRQRLLERIRQAVAEAGVGVEPEQLIREVAIFADRTDVSEEVSRFGAHLEQFAEIAAKGHQDGAGRRLEFVVQELGREANTMGSKAGDVAILRRVVELKATLERIRELIQNVE